MSMSSQSNSNRTVLRAGITFGLLTVVALGVTLPASAATWLERANAKGYSQSISVGTDGCYGIAETTYTLTKVFHTTDCEKRRVRWYGYQPHLGQNGFTSYSYGGPDGEITSQTHAGYAVTGYGALKD